MNTTALNAVIAVIIGIASGVGECFLLRSVIDTITGEKGTPIFRMLCFVGAPLAMLALVIYFLDPMCCIIAGVGATLGLIASALILRAISKNK